MSFAIPSRITRDSDSYTALLEQAHDKGLRSLSTEILAFPGDYNGYHAVIRVIATFSNGSFSAIGEAIQSNDCGLGELLEIAENRAKLRSFADALNLSSPSDGRASSTKRQASTGPSEVRSRPRGPSRDSRDEPPASREETFQRNGNSLSSAQRRFLFRLVVEQGIDPKEAKTAICRLAAVRSIEQISKHQASELIDSLQSGAVRADRSAGEEG